MRNWFAALKSPDVMPAMGIAAATLVWLFDSLVDHVMFNRHEPFVDSLWPDEPQEVWMRLFAVILLIALSFYARALVRKEVSAKEALAQHQAKLENVIAERTAELTRNYEALQKEIAERKRTQEQLEILATTDPLTRLYNRRKFEELLNHELERCKRYAGDFALILFDADHFKQINDQHGHDIGDAVLRFLSDLIRSQLRKSDIVARWGGEEFVALVAEAGPDTALTVADKLRKAVEDGQFPRQLRVTISLGVALARRNDTAAMLMKRADQALYQAKQAGRNRVTLESPEPPPVAVDAER